jgi:hypothetical protein
MNAKALLTAAVLLFVAVSVVMIVLRQAGVEPIESTRDQTPGAAALPLDGLVAYYFHGDTRCPTCRNIEAYAREAIATGFANELASGHVAWRVVNYEAPANRHFATDYEIVAPTIVLVRTKNSEATDWRNLSRVWGLVAEKEAFVEYVQAEAREMLDASAG